MLTATYSSPSYDLSQLYTPPAIVNQAPDPWGENDLRLPSSTLLIANTPLIRKLDEISQDKEKWKWSFCLKYAKGRTEAAINRRDITTTDQLEKQFQENYNKCIRDTCIPILGEFQYLALPRTSFQDPLRLLNAIDINLNRSDIRDEILPMCKAVYPKRYKKVMRELQDHRLMLINFLKPLGINYSFEANSIEPFKRKHGLLPLLNGSPQVLVRNFKNDIQHVQRVSKGVIESSNPTGTPIPPILFPSGAPVGR